MAWIESHQTLGQHPKTQQLATLLRVNLPAAVGHLHYFWWWALDFAPTGVIPNPTPAVVAHAAQWTRDPDKFWLAMIQSGFLEVNEERVSIHDWLDYAGRLEAKRSANRARQRRFRDTHLTRDEDVSNALVTRDVRVSNGATVPNQPVDAERLPLPDQPQPLVTTADAQGAAPHASARKPAPEPPEPAIIHAEAGICPFCRLPYTGSYLEHTSSRHAVKAEPAAPGNLGPSLSHKRRGTPATAPPPEIEAQFAAMHERLQAMPGAS